MTDTFTIDAADATDPYVAANLASIAAHQAAAARHAAMADAPDTSETAVEGRARQVITDIHAGRVGSDTLSEVANAVTRARTNAAATRAINRGMERE